MPNDTSIIGNGDTQSTSVLIVGGGLIGLSLSLFLARQGVASLLVERHAGTSIHPRGASLTARTMEIFRAAGVEAAIRQVEPVFRLDSTVPLVESLAGTQVDQLQDDFSAYFTEASPVHGSLIAQDVLEPVLREQAEQAGADIRFATELLAFAQDEEGITASIRGQNNAIQQVRARFLVAADGNRSLIRQQLGIDVHGAGSMGHFISMIFEADLMNLFRERHAVMCFFSNDTVAGTMTPYPGSKARPDLFRIDISYDPDEESLADYTEARCLPLIRAAIGIPDIAVRLKTVLAWEMAARVANRFQQGRVFLVGDAARVQPPTGALGGNTGIAEAHNLAWKLATVLRGEASPDLLSTYEQERLPLADLTVDQVLLLSQQRNSGSEAITVNPLVVNMGYRYSKGAIVPEDQELLPSMQLPTLWSGQPGTRAPHVVLARQNERLSTLSLFGSQFVLLCGSGGQRWKEGASRLKDDLHLPLTCSQIGGKAGDFLDVDAAFTHAYGITETGAVIVRPDGIIGWRRPSLQGDVAQQLLSACSSLLFHPLSTTSK